MKIFIFGGMMRITTCFGLVILLLLASKASVAAESPQPPRLQYWFSAAEVRAARASVSGPVVRMTYARSETVEGAEPTPPRDIIIVLGEGYATVTENDSTQIFDTRLKRLCIVTPATRSFANFSLHAVVSYRVTELINRLKLGASIRNYPVATAEQKRFFDMYWSEAALGIRLPDQKSRASVSAQDGPDGVINLLYEGNETARFLPSAEDLDGMAAKTLGLVLRNMGGLHPVIVDAIVNKRKAPMEIGFTQIKEKPSLPVVRLRLKKLERTAAEYPLPPDYAPDGKRLGGSLSADIETLKQMVLVQLRGAVQGTLQIGSKSTATFVADIDDALRGNRLLEALLGFLELNQQYPDTISRCTAQSSSDGPCGLRQKMAGLQDRDERVKQLVMGVGTNDSGQYQQALDIWSAIDRTNLPNGHVIDLLMANTATQLITSRIQWEPDKLRSLQATATNGFRAAAEGNPYRSWLYVDVGNFFRGQFDSFTAWDIYDMGRSLPNRSAADPLQAIDQNEGQLVQAFPEFY